MDWHSMTVSKCADTLKTDIGNGMSSVQAKNRLSDIGKNTLSPKKKQGVLVKFISQFKDFMVLILLAAAGISFFTAAAGDGDFIEPVMILIIVILNAAVGTVQECRAEKAIDALKKLSSPHSKVIRNGRSIDIPSEDIVPGDILCVKAGDMVSADARLISSTALKAEESSLTGESVPSDKHHDTVLPAETPPADRTNMIFSSTFITSGHARAIVTETGMDTQVGKIASMIDSEDSPSTPLQKSLEKTGRILGIGAVAICAVIFILGLIQKKPPLEMFMIAISLAVAAIPEGLPAVVTIVLALGVRKMALHRAIIRHLPAVETLGSATVICSDKTGTLTRNKMTVTAVTSPFQQVNAHSSDGGFILSLASLCNNSILERTETAADNNPSFIKRAGIRITGDPTEAAIVSAAADTSLYKDNLDRTFPRLNEFPFDSKRKRMITVHKLSTGGCRIIVKGAPDILLTLCSRIRINSGIVPITNDYRRRIIRTNEDLADRAMRVIAVAYRDSASCPKSTNEAETDLVFCGLIGMTDPPRPQAKAAVEQCIKAGIKPVMITGDHIVTAKAIAREIGIFKTSDMAVTGPELDKMSNAELERVIFRCSVFARVSPEHKVRIVKAFQARGAVAAMTGDGVNDAPALKCSDIGCAMGISGTDAAKSAADMILTDDNFSTIVEAIGQGRGIFENIRKTIHFLLSSNIGEILTVLCAFLLRLPSPLLAMQLLWVNLVTDSLPALALGAEPADPGLMDKKPENTGQGVFSKGMTASIIIEGCFIGALAFLAFTIGRVFYDSDPADPVIGRTMTFAVLSLSQLVHSFNLRSKHSLFRTGILGNPKLIAAFLIGTIMQTAVISVPFLASVFSAVPLTVQQWTIVALLSLMPLVVVESEKLILSESLGNKKQQPVIMTKLPS